MKVPFSWLKQYVDIDVTAQELEDKLFGCGFEVEELIDLGGEISKVVVGVVTELLPIILFVLKIPLAILFGCAKLNHYF